jgi:hypothetical protein
LSQVTVSDNATYQELAELSTGPGVEALFGVKYVEESLTSDQVEHLLRFSLEHVASLCFAESLRHDALHDHRKTLPRVINGRVIERDGQIAL